MSTRRKFLTTEVTGALVLATNIGLFGNERLDKLTRYRELFNGILKKLKKENIKPENIRLDKNGNFLRYVYKTQNKWLFTYIAPEYEIIPVWYLHMPFRMYEEYKKLCNITNHNVYYVHNYAALNLISTGKQSCEHDVIFWQSEQLVLYD